MQEKQSSRNGLISLLKFIFSIIILLYHITRLLNGKNKFSLCLNGYLTVDFFFMVSGYYFYQSLLKINNNIYKENVNFIIKKIKSFLPYTISIGIIMLIFKLIKHSIGKRDIIMSIFNIFLIDMTGLSGYQLNGVTWYISSMLIVFFVLKPIIYNTKEIYTHYICPIIIMFGLGYIYKSAPSLNIFMTGWNGFFYNGLIRALIDINLGILIFILSSKLKNMKENIKYYNLKLNIIGVIIYILIFVYIFFNKNEGAIDYFILAILFIAALTSFSEERLNKIFDKKIIRYLEKISLPIFINHFFVIKLINYYTKTYNNSFIYNTFICTVLVLLLSVIEQFIIENLKKHLTKKISN